MRLATNYDRIHGAGAEVVAVSVDDESRQAGMWTRWGLSHTRMVADPRGQRFLRPLELFDPETRGGIAIPGVLVVAPDGEEIVRYEGRDFADRTVDDAIYAALDGLGLEAIEPEPWAPAAGPPADLTGFFRPADLGPYFRGNRFAAIAIGGRLGDPEAKAVANQHRVMADATLEAWKAWRATVS